MTDRNETLFNRAKAIIPGGVNSPVRAFGSVGGVPRFIKKAQGAYVWDENGTRYTDYVGSWGPAIVGHAHPEVIEAVREAALGGLSFGAPTEGEIVIAEKIAELVPSVEQLRLVSSGTEATMSAIRLARGASADFTKHTLVLEYNNVAQLEETFAQIGGEIACVIVEPFAGNMNLVRPSENFVKALRDLTAKHGAVLIYDEVMTGFRVALGGAQSLHGIMPDLTTMGKVIGGGMPLAAFGGRKDIMECISPLGGVYQAGTLSGNPVAVAAGLKTLEIIRREGFYENLTARTEQLVKGFQTAAAKAGVAFTPDSVGGAVGWGFRRGVPSEDR